MFDTTSFQPGQPEKVEIFSNESLLHQVGCGSLQPFRHFHLSEVLVKCMIEWITLSPLTFVGFSTHNMKPEKKKKQIDKWNQTLKPTNKKKSRIDGTKNE